MAFQAGSRIRPELGNADFSGFANAATIQANSLAQLGATIGGAIQVRAEKKKEKALSKQAKEMLFGMVKNKPELANFFGLPEDFTLDDMTPFVDVMGAKPALALITQLNMASMEARETVRPSVKDAQNLEEYVATLTSPKGNDLVIRNGMIYDQDFPDADDPLPANDPAVIAALGTEEGQRILTGYRDAIYGGTVEDDGTPVEPAEIIETPSINVQEEPTGSRASQLLSRTGSGASQLLSSIQDLNKTRQDAMLSARSLPLALGNFLFSGENPTFSESMNYVKPKMETLETFLPLGASPSPRNLDPRRFRRMYSEGMNFFK